MKSVLLVVHGYNNCAEEINRMCRELYGENARGMTIEDVNKVLGYTAPAITKVNESSSWSNIVTNNNNRYEGKFYTPASPEGKKDGGTELGNYDANGYSYEISSVSSGIATTAKNVIFGNNGTNFNYRLASSGAFVDSDRVLFGPGIVSNGDVCSYHNLLDSCGRSNDRSFCIRAVISLNSEIPAGGAVLNFEGQFGGSSILV
mgnify:CR=1 FL=1